MEEEKAIIHKITKYSNDPWTVYIKGIKRHNSCILFIPRDRKVEFWREHIGKEFPSRLIGLGMVDNMSYIPLDKKIRGVKRYLLIKYHSPEEIAKIRHISLEKARKLHAKFVAGKDGI
jgi:hypothetical protein